MTEHAAESDAPLTEGEKYAICKAAFEVYGPLGYAVGNHSNHHLIEEVERVLAARRTAVITPGSDGAR